ncbi:MAG: PIN domain-containing protein [Synergistaceae bacterium]|jgi:predicted nucleic-acid-binding protein|nr:PIN domain-containing protein [Synergistaceae bacterium]
MLTFVDANIFIRLFAERDNETQIAQSEQLLLAAQRGEVDLVTGPPVFFEVAWVLERRYKTANDKILDVLEAILSFPNLRVLDKEQVVAAIGMARAKGAAFADSYIMVTAANVKADNVATFNKKHFSDLGTRLYPFKV